jgi:hypothetical protein
VEGLDFLCRDAELAAHGSIGVLSEFAAVPPRNATVQQPPEWSGHAPRLLLEGGPHPPRGSEERRVARIEKVRIEGSAVELRCSSRTSRKSSGSVLMSTGGMRVFPCSRLPPEHPAKRRPRLSSASDVVLNRFQVNLEYWSFNHQTVEAEIDSLLREGDRLRPLRSAQAVAVPRTITRRATGISSSPENAPVRLRPGA